MRWTIQTRRFSITSGRTSNEAAFVYQLFVRAFGTNNLPDCSNMCHESTSVALAEVIGIGKASVTLDDVYNAQLLVLAGQNPGTNHPRMLSALEVAKRRGAKILTINPLREAGLVNFRNPQVPRGVVGRGTDLSDLHLPIKINGDLALFQAFGHLLVKWGALDEAFITHHTHGFDSWRSHVSDLDWDFVTTTTGLSRDQITEAAQLLRGSSATVFCWAMGLTQHHNSVATIKGICNVAFAQGNIGKPGAGLLPVRGHSNAQPISPGLWRDSVDTPHSWPDRDRRAGNWTTIRYRRGLHLLRPCIARATDTGKPGAALRGVHCLQCCRGDPR
jgi:molybdopterin-dependent oxidoreductase alpha subunit